MRPKIILLGGGGGAGTVTAVSIATANGFSGSSSGGATPALTIVAGAITPTSVNGNFFTTGSSTYTGTAGQTYTFPTTSATLARTDAGNTFTGASTATSWNLITPNIGAASGTSLVLTGGVTTGSGSGVAGADWSLQGTAPTPPANSIGYYAPASVPTAYGISFPSAPTTGLVFRTGTSSPQAETIAPIVAVANGGTGTATPALVAGTNVTISGSWPNQTINSSGGSSSAGSLFSSTADGTNNAVASDTSITGTGVGSKTTAANYFSAGTTMIMVAKGVVSTAAVPDSLTIKIKAGSVVVANATGVSLTGALSSSNWEFYALITCRTAGASGVFKCVAIFAVTGSALTPLEAKITDTGNVVDTTGTIAWDLTALWGSTTAGDTITANNFMLSAPGGPGAVVAVDVLGALAGSHWGRWASAGTSTTINTFGWAMTALGTVASVAADSTAPYHVKYTHAAATAGTFSGVEDNGAQLQVPQNASVTGRIKTAGSVQRVWFGFNTGGSFSGTTPGASQHSALVRWDSATDTNFQCLTKDGTTASTTDSGASAAVGWHTFQVTINSGANVVFTIDGTVITKTTNLPASGDLRFVCFSETTENVVKVIEILDLGKVTR